MLNIKPLLFGERSVTKVVGLFRSRNEADAAVQELLADSGLSAAQIKLLAPADALPSHGTAFDKAVEPEVQGIWRTIIRAHLTMGTIGLLAGLGLYGVLMLMHHPAVTSSANVAFWTFCGFGITFGLLIGGALSLRPDHGRLINLVRRGLQRGQWAVVAHPFDASQTHRAMASLAHDSLKVMRSF